MCEFLSLLRRMVEAFLLRMDTKMGIFGYGMGVIPE